MLAYDEELKLSDCVVARRRIRDLVPAEDREPVGPELRS